MPIFYFEEYLLNNYKNNELLILIKFMQKLIIQNIFKKR